ncbi:MAG: HAD family phosphatase [Candidatus Dadabacteria bacterium]|nr:MAG: HAD family phosphatase [Candidatus Dadabacteria bacterium]
MPERPAPVSQAEADGKQPALLQYQPQPQITQPQQITIHRHPGDHPVFEFVAFYAPSCAAFLYNEAFKQQTVPSSGAFLQFQAADVYVVAHHHKVLLPTDTKFCLFDFDNTLASTEFLHIASIGSVARDKLGAELSVEQLNQIEENVMGKPEQGSFKALSSLLKQWTGKTQNEELSAETLMNHRREIIASWAEKGALDNKIGLMPGMENLLRSLKQQGVALGICTSSSCKTVKLIVKNTPLLEFFPDDNQYVCAGDDILEGKTKPHPKPYLTAAQKLGFNGEDLAYGAVFEDSLGGMLSAVRAGIGLVVLRPSFEDGVDARDFLDELDKRLEREYIPQNRHCKPLVCIVERFDQVDFSFPAKD